MKTIPATVLNSYNRVGCFKVVRTDATVLGFTNHDKDITYDSVTYEAASGFRRSATRQTADLAPDNLELFGLFDSAAITEEDIVAGLYDGAEVYYFELDWTNPSAGIYAGHYGRIGQVKHTRNGFTAEFLDLAMLLETTIGGKYQHTCPYTLGDSDCGVTLEPSDWAASTAYAVGDVVKATSYDNRRYICSVAGTSDASEPTWDTTIGNTTTETGGVEWVAYQAFTSQGTVTGATDRQTFADTGRTEADDWFRFGKITWVTGNNAGLSEDVKSYGSSGAIILKYPMPFNIQTGDTYTMTAGCNHQKKMPGDTWGTAYTGDCRAKFDNVLNFGGQDDIPGADLIVAGPK